MVDRKLSVPARFCARPWAICITALASTTMQDLRMEQIASFPQLTREAEKTAEAVRLTS